MKQPDFKICGITDPKNAQEVLALNPSIIGIIHYPKSPRHVTELEMASLFEVIPEGQQVALVTVNETSDTLQHLLTRFPFTHVQLHGDESEDLVHILKGICTVIEALPIKDLEDVHTASQYLHADLLLFDTKGPKPGGNGYAFDWSLLVHYDGPTPFMLSGGINSRLVDEIREFNHKRCVGIDLNSGFETSPGIKNADLIKDFLNDLSHELSNS